MRSTHLRCSLVAMILTVLALSTATRLRADAPEAPPEVTIPEAPTPPLSAALDKEKPTTESDGAKGSGRVKAVSLRIDLLFEDACETAKNIVDDLGAAHGNLAAARRALDAAVAAKDQLPANAGSAAIGEKDRAIKAAGQALIQAKQVSAAQSFHSSICTTPRRPPVSSPDNVTRKLLDGLTDAEISALPPSFFGIDVRQDSRLCRFLASEGSVLSGPGFQDLMTACGVGSQRGLLGATTTANLIQGLSDFLMKRAKEEAKVYLTEHLAQRVCFESHATCAPARKTKGELFPKSCQELYPGWKTPGLTECEFDVSAITTGRAVSALREDAAGIPKVWLDKLVDECTSPPDTAEVCARSRAWRELTKAITKELVHLENGKSPADFIALLASDLDLTITAEDARKLACDFTSQEKPSVPCVGLLLLEVGREGAVQTNGGSPNLNMWIENAARSFCGRYSTKADTACLVNDAYAAKWHRVLLAATELVQDLKAVDDAIQHAQKNDDDPEDILRAVGPKLGGAVEKLGDFLADVMELKSATFNEHDDERNRNDRTVKIERVRQSFGLVGALLARDTGKVQVKLGALLATFEDREWVRAAQFCVALATAGDADKVAETIEQFAEPVGSYRAKYSGKFGRHASLNAFVGGFFGHQWNHATVDGKDDQMQATRLAAPVGFDWTLWRLRKGRHHLGFFVPIVDPFNFTLAGKKEDRADTDWRTILSPGVFFRWGIGHSPFTLLVGGTWQPALRSDEECGGKRCWEGATQAGVSLAVDIPLLRLH